MVDYYQRLYSSSNSCVPFADMSSIIPSLVTESDNGYLTTIPTDEEIKNCVFSMDPGSAPGLDGFSGAFYQNCWNIVGSDVCRGVRQFFQCSWLYPNMNSNFIVFIPKSPDANEITKFRPIALANFFFKIIPKILADRLASVASRIVSPHQHAFIKGRKITDCIALVSEGIHFIDKKAHGGNVGFKLDVTKAFDTMDWEFILSVLRHFGFCETLICWVKTILESAKLSVLINRSPYGFFGCSRGVRQGDPLSPILFFLPS